MTFAEAAALRKAAQRTVRARPPTRLRSDTPRPPPKANPNPIMYEAVARPGAYYERPKIKRDLPIVKVRAQLSLLVSRYSNITTIILRHHGAHCWHSVWSASRAGLRSSSMR